MSNGHCYKIRAAIAGDWENALREIKDRIYFFVGERYSLGMLVAGRANTGEIELGEDVEEVFKMRLRTGSFSHPRFVSAYRSSRSSDVNAMGRAAR